MALLSQKSSLLWPADIFMKANNWSCSIQANYDGRNQLNGINYFMINFW